MRAKTSPEGLLAWVGEVIDGDTIRLVDGQGNKWTVRLAGIDAPEISQDFGEDSRNHLASRILFSEVTAVGTKLDRNGRLVAVVYESGTDANLEQLRLGLAWHFKRYAKEQSSTDRELYSAAEQLARSEGSGLWASPQPIPPWEYRLNRKPQRLVR